MVLSTYVEQVSIQAGKGCMDGVLWLPENAVGVILLADGRVGCRVKPPIDYVGTVLRNARLGTFWLDLQTDLEVYNQQAGSEVDILAQRLEAACDWLRNNDSTCDMPVGLFGAGSGAPAALQLAAVLGQKVFAVVLRGGRPDLPVRTSLGRVHAPTLLIAGSLDDRVVGLNRAIYAGLRCKKQLEIIPGATHSFEEPGSLEVVARLTRAWFLQNVRLRHM